MVLSLFPVIEIIVVSWLFTNGFSPSINSGVSPDTEKQMTALFVVFARLLGRG